MGTKSNSPTAAERELTAAQYGVQTVLPASKHLVVNGESLLPSEIDRRLGEYAQAHAKVRVLRAQLREALAERKRLAPTAREFVQHLKAAVINLFGDKSSLLESFGWKPRKEAVRRGKSADEPTEAPAPSATPKSV